MALEFGADDHISVTDDGTYDLTLPITLEFWIKSDGIVDDGAGFYRFAFALYSDPEATKRLEWSPLNWHPPFDTYYIYQGRQAGAEYAIWSYGNDRTNHPLWDQEWHHMAFVMYATEANCLLYIDGISEGAPDDNTALGIADPDETTTVRIGSSAALGNYLGAGNARYLDEVRLWNDARTAKEIRTNMYRRVVGGEGLVGCFRLDEPTGTTAYDLLKGPNGTLNNFPASPWRPSGAISYMGGARPAI